MVGRHPWLRCTFFQRSTPTRTIYIIWKLWSQGIQKYIPRNHPKSARKSSPNTFFSARVAEGNSDILFVYLFFVAEFPDRLTNRWFYLGIFETIFVIYILWTSGNTVALLLWRFPIISLNFPFSVNNFKGSHLIWVRKTWFDSFAMEGCHLLCKNEFLDQDDWWITGHAQWVPMHSAYPRMHSKCSIELNLLFLVWLKKISSSLYVYT